MKQKRQETNLLERLYHWLQFRESFQFDTDLPLEECVQRLYLLDFVFGKSPFLYPYTTVEYYHQDDYNRFRILVDIPTKAPVIVEGSIWERENIIYVNGETWLDIVPGLVANAALSLLLFLFSLFIKQYAIFFFYILVGLPLVLHSYRANIIRTDLIHHLYDILDHENESRLALGEFEEFYGHTVLEKKKQNRGT